MFIFGLIVGLVVGAVVGVFVYRNNQKEISSYADKIDELYDKIEELAREKAKTKK